MLFGATSGRKTLGVQLRQRLHPEKPGRHSPRARNGAKAKDTGLSREGLYRSLSADGNPEFATILKVIKALGLSLHVGSSAGV
jgi:hypothetical protein